MKRVWEEWSNPVVLYGVTVVARVVMLGRCLLLEYEYGRSRVL